jgi:hypothetical protein
MRDIGVDLHSLPILGSPSVTTQLDAFATWSVQIGAQPVFGQDSADLPNAQVEVCILP